MGSAVERNCGRRRGCSLSAGDQHPHHPGFLWPGSLAQTVLGRKEEVLGVAAPDLPLSEPGWRYTEPDHPGRKCPGAAGERDLPHPKHPGAETARSRRAQRSLHTVPALLRSERRQALGWEV